MSVTSNEKLDGNLPNFCTFYRAVSPDKWGSSFMEWLSEMLQNLSYL